MADNEFYEKLNEIADEFFKVAKKIKKDVLSDNKIVLTGKEYSVKFGVRRANNSVEYIGLDRYSHEEQFDDIIDYIGDIIPLLKAKKDDIIHGEVYDNSKDKKIQELVGEMEKVHAELSGIVNNLKSRFAARKYLRERNKLEKELKSLIKDYKKVMGNDPNYKELIGVSDFNKIKDNNVRRDLINKLRIPVEYIGSLKTIINKLQKIHEFELFNYTIKGIKGWKKIHYHHNFSIKDPEDYNEENIRRYLGKLINFFKIIDKYKSEQTEHFSIEGYDVETMNKQEKIGEKAKDLIKELEKTLKERQKKFS